MRFDCDACCREQVGCDWSRAYCNCAEGADWVADVGYRLYVLDFAGVAAFFVFVVLLLGGRL